MPNASGCEPQPLEPPRAAREGADRSGPEARRPPSDRKAGSPRGKGWLIPCTSSSPAWRPVSRCSSRRRRRSAADVDRAGRGTRRHAAARGPRRRRRPARSRRTAIPATRARANSAGGALEAATAGDWSGRWASFGDTRSRPSRASAQASNAGDTSGTYWSFWLNYKYATAGRCGTPMQDGDDVLFFPSCFGDGCDREPTPLRIASAPASASPGAGVRRERRAVPSRSTRTSTRSRRRGAGARGARWPRATAAHRRRRDGDRSRASGRARRTRGVRASKAGYVRDQATAAGAACELRPCARRGRHRASAHGGGARDTAAPATTLTRAGERRGLLAPAGAAAAARHAWPRIRRGCWRSSCG